jgi:hypothetical protein
LAGVTVEIGTEHLPKASLERYRSANPLAVVNAEATVWVLHEFVE